jgi:trimethylamine--corrinoid protein Co-methyltransferase
MARPGLSGGQYCPLTQEQILQIHKASLEVLERTGLHVKNERARTLFEQGGARIEGDRVFISEQMVQKALVSVPSRVLLAGRDPAHDVVLEGKRVYAGTGGSPTMMLDPGADTVRPATLRDLQQVVRLVDKLPNCDFVVMPVYPTDVPEEVVPVNRFYACLSNTTKHVMGGVGTPDGARDVITLATQLAGSLEALQARPIVSAITSWMVSPLHLDTAVTDILLEWCSHGLPLALSSAPMAGTTAPITLAGSLVQLNAEQLSGIVLTQLARPGTPVLAGYIPGVADMRSGNYLGGTVEFGMMQAAAAQLAQYYHVPIYCSGCMTDAKIPDEQAGYEKMATFLLAAMGGANYIHHAIGMVHNMSAVSLEQAVIDDEIVGMVQRVLRGIDVNDETLGVESIARVGPGGHFLMDPLTLAFMRSEYFPARVSDRQNRAAWESEGKRDIRARASARVDKLLADPPAPLWTVDIDAALRAQFTILSDPS